MLPIERLYYYKNATVYHVFVIGSGTLFSAPSLYSAWSPFLTYHHYPRNKNPGYPSL